MNDVIDSPGAEQTGKCSANCSGRKTSDSCHPVRPQRFPYPPYFSGKIPRDSEGDDESDEGLGHWGAGVEDGTRQGGDGTIYGLSRHGLFNWQSVPHQRQTQQIMGCCTFFFLLFLLRLPHTPVPCSRTGPRMRQNRQK